MPLAMTDAGVPAPGGVPLSVLSMVADGSPVIRVTTNGPHGLAPNQQIAVQGTQNPRASGMFSVSPLTATLFTYGCYDWIPAGSMLSPETMITLVVTA